MGAEFIDASSDNESGKARYYSWTDALSCGHEGIDADHRHLFDIAERLRAASLPGQENVEVGQLLVELMDYVHGHFAREEALMQAISYPGYADHQFEHSLLMRRVRKLHDDFVKGMHISQKEVWQFLRRWLRYHIMNADMQMAQYASKAMPAR